MAMRTPGSTKLVALTPALTKRISELPNVPHGRELSENRIEVLRAKLSDGAITTFVWATCTVDGTTYRVNGQHSSTMLASLPPETFPTDLKVTLEEWNAATLEELASIYAQYDARFTMRTCNNIYRVTLGGSHLEGKMATKTFEVCSSGMAYAEFGNVHSSQMGADRRAEFAARHGDFCLMVESVLGNDNEAQRMLRRAPIVGAMWLTWKRSQTDSRKFWTAVKTGSDPNPSSVTRTLQKYLLSTSVSTGRGAAAGKVHEPREYVIVRCIHAWNAFRAGETPRKLPVRTTEIPQVK